MAAKYWIKLYHEVLDDAKMGRMPDRLWRRTIELFLLAGEHDRDGELPRLDDMAWRLRVEPQDLMQEIHALSKMGIVTIEGDELLVTNFAKRQGASSSAERMKEFRKRSKDKDTEKEDIYIHSVPSHVTVTNVTNGNGKRYESSHFDKLLPCLVKAVKTPYGAGVNEDEFEQAIYTLIGWDVTPEQVEGFGEWWKTNGHYKGLPALKSFVAEFRNYLSGVKTNQGNGKAPDNTTWQRIVTAVTNGVFTGLSSDEKTALRAIGGLPVIKAMTPYDEPKLKSQFFQALGAT